jgi:hypothetical protein
MCHEKHPLRKREEGKRRKDDRKTQRKKQRVGERMRIFAYLPISWLSSLASGSLQ